MCLALASPACIHSPFFFFILIVILFLRISFSPILFFSASFSISFYLFFFVLLYLLLALICRFPFFFPLSFSHNRPQPLSSLFSLSTQTPLRRLFLSFSRCRLFNFFLHFLTFPLIVTSSFPRLFPSNFVILGSPSFQSPIIVSSFSLSRLSHNLFIVLICCCLQPHVVLAKIDPITSCQ